MMPEAAPEHRMLLADKIGRRLRMRIARGGYLPGDLMPPERELACEFGVSRTSISAALSVLAKEGLIEQTRGRGTRVVPVRERLTSGPICVLYPFDTHGLTAEGSHLLHGIQDALARLGYTCELIPKIEDMYQAQSDRAVRKSSIPTLANRYGAFVCLETLGSEQALLAFEERRIPLVVANLEVNADLTATYVDHGKTTRSAVETLAAFGHRRIAYLGTEPSQFFYAKSQAGYFAGLDAARIPRDESLIALCPQTRALDAYLAIKPLLAAASPPTAIVAARDHLAEGAYRAIQEANLTLGRDISMIGFDDFSWPMDDPFLTTFREPAYEMCKVAAEILVERLVSGWRPPEQREIEAPLIIRRSVGPPPEAALTDAGKGHEVAFPPMLRNDTQ